MVRWKEEGVVYLGLHVHSRVGDPEEGQASSLAVELMEDEGFCEGEGPWGVWECAWAAVRGVGEVSKTYAVQ